MPHATCGAGCGLSCGVNGGIWSSLLKIVDAHPRNEQFISFYALPLKGSTNALTSIDADGYFISLF